VKTSHGGLAYTPVAVSMAPSPRILPTVQASKFEFVIDACTARMLGPAVPQQLLAVADEVIESCRFCCNAIWSGLAPHCRDGERLWPPPSRAARLGDMDRPAKPAKVESDPEQAAGLYSRERRYETARLPRGRDRFGCLVYGSASPERSSSGGWVPPQSRTGRRGLYCCCLSTRPTRRRLHRWPKRQD